ncbi:hypothetical protein, partial [Niveispirillum fermenti]|uniref:hypothetical protein n=1 Tax=Niveispirillum fermenti TaxID=1233113 RepID=UPI003A853774
MTSVALAVMPTAVPLAAPSTTLLAVLSLSVGVAGAAFVTLMVKVWVLVSTPSLAWTVMEWLVAVSK